MNRQELTQKIIKDIFAELANLGDVDYCDALDEISGACDDASAAKRYELKEMEGANEI
jgi:hypothetical protein